ncbi:Hypothetical predicted protein [Octopus vulgaris]|uniref:Uncharacterized protein n=1 Tax=Octopus vulgaris TaxID=6645 RepID=A0AA36FEH0_OCTVU|nr:Hypothetical predicted protein [Octopus vulgaris]
MHTKHCSASEACLPPSCHTSTTFKAHVAPHFVPISELHFERGNSFPKFFQHYFLLLCFRMPTSSVNLVTQVILYINCFQAFRHLYFASVLIVNNSCVSAPSDVFLLCLPATDLTFF